MKAAAEDFAARIIATGFEKTTRRTIISPEAPIIIRAIAIAPAADPTRPAQAATEEHRNDCYKYGEH